MNKETLFNKFYAKHGDFQKEILLINDNDLLPKLFCWYNFMDTS